MIQDVAQIIFTQKSELLLGFRLNTQVLNQLWGFPSGRIEPGELPEAGAIRESKEEVSVEPLDLLFLGVIPDPEKESKHYFYICTKWKGTIKNAEPHLCREVLWFNINNLPENCTPITNNAIKQFSNEIESLNR